MKLWWLGLVVVGLLLAADDAKKTDKTAKQIEGKWQGVSLEQDGNKNEDAKDFIATIHDGRYEVKRGDELTSKGKVKLDTAKKPHTMDIMVEEGDAAGQTELGIYEVKKGRLRICYARPDKPRPTEFTAKEGSGNTLVVLKRIKDKKS